MSDLTLAQLSMLSLYSAMVVFVLSMLAYAVFLAGLMPARDERAVRRERAAERELVGATVGAGAPGGAGAAAAVEDADALSDTDSPASTPSDADSAASAPSRADAAGGIDLDIPLRARKAAGSARGLAFLGTGLLIAAVLLRGLEVHRAPLANMFEFALVGSMFVMLAYLLWSMRADVRWLGCFVVAFVLVTLGLAITVWYTDAQELVPSLRSVWLVIHVSVATISIALFSIGAVIGALYLWQARVEERGVRSFLNKFPTAKRLEKLTYALHILAFPLLTFTVIAGAIWARQAWGSYWNWDPKEVWTFVIWVVYAAYLHARVTSGWRRQSATWIALAGFACIVVNYIVVNVYFVGQHSYSGL